MLNTTQEYIKENYTSTNHYDLAMDILCDLLIDNLTDLKKAVNTFFGTDDDEAIIQAFQDYNDTEL